LKGIVAANVYKILLSTVSNIVARTSSEESKEGKESARAESSCPSNGIQSSCPVVDLYHTIIHIFFFFSILMAIGYWFVQE
jgi:hypothetical protein